MDIRDIKMILETRMKVADKSGNTTEKSFLFELYKMAEEQERLKDKHSNCKCGESCKCQ